MNCPLVEICISIKPRLTGEGKTQKRTPEVLDCCKFLWFKKEKALGADTEAENLKENVVIRKKRRDKSMEGHHKKIKNHSKEIFIFSIFLLHKIKENYDKNCISECFLIQTSTR